MEKSEAKKTCANYRNLDRRRVIIAAYNEGAGYHKMDPPIDANCEHCDRYPTLMVMKICCRLRLRPRIVRWWWIIKNFHRLYRLHSPIVRR